MFPIPYDPNLILLAREFRKNPTEAEKRIWDILLSNRKIKNYKFVRQKPIYYYILDFYCAKLMLGIEVDGQIHIKRREYDYERTKEISSFGIKIIRYKNAEVIEKITDVRKNLLRQMALREKELSDWTPQPPL